MENQYMTFKNEDLLTKAEIEELINGDFPHDKANLVASKLSKYCFVKNNKSYSLLTNVTYVEEESTTKNEAHITNLTTILIEASFKNLSNEQQQLIKLTFKKDYAKVFQNNHVKAYLPQLISKLNKPNVKLNMHLRQLHFNNGYIDLNDGLLKQREVNVHYVSKYIRRDYIKSTVAQQDKLMTEYIGPIIPYKDDQYAIFNMIGGAISGESNIDQTVLCPIGFGSAGKSALMKTTELAIGPYFKEFASDMFTADNKNIDKTINTYENEPQIRITYVNEPDTAKTDTSLFKKFCEGRLQTNRLYQEATHEVIHYSMLFTTSNLMPNFVPDQGVIRRFRGYQPVSQFVDDIKDVDISKHVYLKNINFLRDIVEMQLLDAWIDILAKYCSEWLTGKRPVLTENFKQTTNTVMTANDKIQDFIDAKLILTNNVEDRIGKLKMHALYKEIYPTSHITMQQLISEIKDKRIDYQFALRSNNVKGCFTGVKCRNETLELVEDEPNALEYGLEKQSNIEEIKHLRSEIDRLNKLLEQKTTPPPTITTTIITETKPSADQRYKNILAEFKDVKCIINEKENYKHATDFKDACLCVDLLNDLF